MTPDADLGAVKDYGPGIGASVAAKWRSRGEYLAAAQLEGFYGERRTWDDRGLTMHWRWMPELGEFSHLIRGFYDDEYGVPQSPFHWEINRDSTS